MNLVRPLLASPATSVVEKEGRKRGFSSPSCSEGDSVISCMMMEMFKDIPRPYLVVIVPYLYSKELGV